MIEENKRKNYVQQTKGWKTSNLSEFERGLTMRSSRISCLQSSLVDCFVICEAAGKNLTPRPLSGVKDLGGENKTNRTTNRSIVLQ